MAAGSQLSISADLHPGYRLGRLLGRGGFGEVWAAEASDGTPVALKFLAYSSALTAVHELRSIQIVRQLQHPNLIRIDKVWASKGCLVVVMELADGSLADLLDICQIELGTPILAEHLHPFLVQAAEGIDFLNTRQHLIDGQRVALQHCDINPRNLLVFGETVKLCDFSLTSVLTSSQKEHRRAGTLDYAAPEVFQGRLSAQCDQYAFAVSYCLLRGGRLPFSDTPAQFDTNYVRPVPDLSMLPKAEQAIISRALAIGPEQRWPSCQELVAQLGKVTKPGKAVTTPAKETERRTTARYKPSAETSCQLLPALGKDSWLVVVHNLSTGGVRLHVLKANIAFESDQPFIVVLRNKPTGFGRVIRIRVKNVTRLEYGAFELGCAFNNALSAQDINLLVKASVA